MKLERDVAACLANDPQPGARLFDPCFGHSKAINNPLREMVDTAVAGRVEHDREMSAVILALCEVSRAERNCSSVRHGAMRRDGEAEQRNEEKAGACGGRRRTCWG